MDKYYKKFDRGYIYKSIDEVNIIMIVDGNKSYLIL